MNIGIVGKGGTGKTAVAALLSRWYARHFGFIRAIDLNPVLDLARALGVDDPELTEVRTATNGENGSSADPEAYFAVQGVDGIEVAVPTTCLRSALPSSDAAAAYGAVSALLDHADADALTVVDFSGGLELLGTSILPRLDLVLVVCEPSDSSLRIWQTYSAAAAPRDTLLRVIGNKVRDKYDVHRIRREVGDEILTCFANSEVIADLDRGRRVELEALEFGNQEALALLTRFVHKLRLRENATVARPCSGEGSTRLLGGDVKY
jgi:CO dehydrogenase maturation factor